MLFGYIRFLKIKGNNHLDEQKNLLISTGVDEENIVCDDVDSIKDEQPKLRELLECIQEHDCLVIYELNDLRCSLSQLINYIIHLKNKNIDLISISDKFDTTKPQGRFIFKFFDRLHEFEKLNHKYKIMEGLEVSKLSGNKNGRPLKIDNDKLVSILKALDSGQSKASICRTYQIHRTTLYDYINRSKVSTRLLAEYQLS